MEQWKIVEKDENESGPYWVTFSDTGLKARFEWQAGVKLDGCIELIRRYNMGDDAEGAGQIHLCDLDELIARLQALRTEAKKILGPRHGLYEDVHGSEKDTFTHETFKKLKALPHPPELDKPNPADADL